MKNEAREELLSAYLDNGLSGDELAFVEQLLQNDASAAAQLEKLRSLQGEVRAAMPTDARLGADFPDRVWAAVLAQADAENLPDTHPVRLAQARDAAGNSNGHRRRWVGGLVALAASLMMILAWNAGEPDVEPVDNSISGGLAANATPADTPSVDAATPVAVPPPAIPAPEMIASNAIAPAENDPPVKATSVEPAESNSPEERIAMAASPQPTAAVEEPKIASTPSPSMVADANKLEFAVLLEVELTQRGRDLNELEFALETAGISDVQPQPMSRETVGQLVRGKTIGTVNVEAPQAIQGDTQLLLLKGSAKRLDRFMLSLFNHQSVIKSVGFQMAIDPDLVAAIGKLSSADPSSIRHADTEALAQHLTFGAAGVEAKMFPRAAQSSFFPLTEESAKQLKWSPEAPSDVGPDFQTQLLVLVRCPQ